MLGIFIGAASSSLAIISINHFGWRNTYRIIGGISLFVTILTFFIKEPLRGSYNNEAKNEEMKKIDQSQSPIRKFFDQSIFVVKNSVFLILLAATTMRFFGGYALGFWAAKFYVKRFPDFQTAYSIIHTLTVLVVGVPSHYTAGHV